MRLTYQKLFVIFLLLLLSFGCVQNNPQQLPPTGTADMFKLDAASIVSTNINIQNGTPGMWGWVSPSFLALTTSAVLLALLYLFGVLGRSPSVMTYVKQELLELVISAFLAIIVLGSIASLATIDMESSLPAQFFPQPTGTFHGVVKGTSVYGVTSAPLELAGYFVGSWLDMSYLLNVIVDQFASVTPYARPLSVGLVATPFAGFFSPIKQLLYNMSVALSVAYIIMYAQLFAYVFSLQAFLHYYLPIGIFLRCFTPTRRVGGTLIGISVAFLLVYPIVTTVTFSILLSGLGSPLVSWTGFLNDFFSNASPEHFLDALTSSFSHHFPNGSDSGFTDIVSGTYGSIGSALQTAVGNFFTLLLIIPVSIVALAFLFAFLIPAFNVLVFVESAKRFSGIFGDEVDINSLTRMI